MYSPAIDIFSISRPNLSFTHACQSASRINTLTPSESMLRMVSAKITQPRWALPLGSKPMYALTVESPPWLSEPDNTPERWSNPTTSSTLANILSIDARTSGSRAFGVSRLVICTTQEFSSLLSFSPLPAARVLSFSSRAASISAIKASAWALMSSDRFCAIPMK